MERTRELELINSIGRLINSIYRKANLDFSSPMTTDRERETFEAARLICRERRIYEKPITISLHKNSFLNKYINQIKEEWPFEDVSFHLMK